jgi:hypothetical protein
MINIPLHPQTFGERSRLVAAAPDLYVHAFRYASGVEGLSVTTPRLELEVLPFRGQQIWRLRIDGEDVGMRGMLAAPTAAPTLPESFGAMFYHCGLLGIAAPGPDDDHPLHGELPQAAMQAAALEIEEAPEGIRLRITGYYEHTRVFAAHYLAKPSVALTVGAATIEVAMHVTNLMGAPFRFAYLGHANFRPVDGARLHYSAPYDTAHVRVRQDVPAHLGAGPPGYRDLLAHFAANPTAHHHLAPGQAFDPEVVFLIDYMADEEGWAHSLQVHPDGRADWIAHRPDQCPRAVRWLSRTPDQDCIAIAEPTTSGIEGRTAEERAGRLAELAPGATWKATMRMGRLGPDDAVRMVAHVDRVGGRQQGPSPRSEVG